MDLVKSYDSDMDEDSTDIEEIPTQKEFDVIDLDSDSTEDESVVESEKVTKTKTTSDSVSTPEELECIILDSPVREKRNDSSSQPKETCIGLDTSVKKTLSDLNSHVKNICRSLDSVTKKTCSDQNSQMGEICIDLDSPLKKTSSDAGVIDSTGNDPPVKKLCINPNSNVEHATVRRTSEIDSISSSNLTKKIDYLNLEDSESENECETVEKNINTLRETASILNEVSCGPEKPTTASNILDNMTGNASLTQQVGKTIVSNLITDSNSARNTPDSLQNSASHDSTEHLGSCDKESVEPFPLKDNKNSDMLSHIFREDSHIVEASKKIVVSHIPRQVVHTHNAHTKIITSLSWCIPKLSYLFLSASHDGSIKIWDLYRTNSVQCLKDNFGLNAAKWSLDGGQIVAGGFGNKAYVYDVQTGAKLVEYHIYNVVTSIECHPYLEDVFLVGTRNGILGFDVRVNTTYPVRIFYSECEEVLDIAFLDENEFICSGNIVSHNSADRTIMAWDFSSGAKLSNEIYLERYTCPSLKVHPSDSSFIAQTNGDYIASFSTHRPYKMKDKRYTGHTVAGYAIECDISPDGKYTVSGDVEGSLHFYNYSTTSTVFVTPKQKVPTNKVKWNPVLPSTLISSTYDGRIQLWK